MRPAHKFLSFATVIASALLIVSCGPSVKTFEGKDFTFTAPSSLEVSGKSSSRRGAVHSTMDLTDPKSDVTYNVEVVYAMLNPQYVLEDGYGLDIESAGVDGMYVACNDFGNVYAFNQDSCTVILTIPGEGELTVNDFTGWSVNHSNEAAAARCDHHPENDRPFLYEAYGAFSPNIDYAITDDYISMRKFVYNPDTNEVDITIYLRDMTRDSYMAHKENNDAYISSRVKGFAESTGYYHTYCRTKEAPLKISVYDTFGVELPVITVDL